MLNFLVILWMLIGIAFTFLLVDVIVDTLNDEGWCLTSLSHGQSFVYKCNT